MKFSLAAVLSLLLSSAVVVEARLSGGGTRQLQDDLLQLTVPGNNGEPANKFPLGECQGDCDSDIECGEGLFCLQRELDDEVPGCVGGLASITDFCIKEIYRVDGSAPSGPMDEPEVAATSIPTSPMTESIMVEGDVVLEPNDMDGADSATSIPTLPVPEDIMVDDNEMVVDDSGVGDDAIPLAETTAPTDIMGGDIIMSGTEAPTEDGSMVGSVDSSVEQQLEDDVSPEVLAEKSGAP